MKTSPQRCGIILFVLLLHLSFSDADCESGLIEALALGGGQWSASSCSAGTEISITNTVFIGSSLIIDGLGYITLIGATASNVFSVAPWGQLTLANTTIRQISFSNSGSLILKNCNIATQTTQYQNVFLNSGEMLLKNSIVHGSASLGSLIVSSAGVIEVKSSTITSFPQETNYPIIDATGSTIASLSFCTVFNAHALKGSSFDVVGSVIVGRVESTYLSGDYSFFSTNITATTFAAPTLTFGVNSSQLVNTTSFRNTTGFSLPDCSPAINSFYTYDPSVHPPDDQNGNSRNQEGAPDAGAVESNLKACLVVPPVAVAIEGHLLVVDVYLAAPSVPTVTVAWSIGFTDGPSPQPNSGWFAFPYPATYYSVIVPLSSNGDLANQTGYMLWTATYASNPIPYTNVFVFNDDLPVPPGNCGPLANVHCLDGTCATKPALCQVPCDFIGDMFTCHDGGCSATPNNCAAQFCIDVLCWDGSCKGIAGCPVVPACPPLTTRCLDGSCKTSCQSEQSACTLSNKVTCPDGTCVNNLAECDPYNGCPTGYVSCFDGSCVTKVSECRCDAVSFKCFDGSCKGECPPALPLLKPLEVSYFFSSGDKATVDILSADAAKTFLGSITTKGNLSSDISVSVSGVPDSQSKRPDAMPQDHKQVSTAVRLRSSPEEIDVGPMKLVLAIEESVASENADNFCFATFSEEEGWKCTEETLVVTKESNKTVVEGSVERFSDYSVLFADNQEETDGQTSSDPNNRNVVIASSVVVCAAIVAVGAAVAYITWKKRKETKSEEIALNASTVSSY